MFDLTIVTPTKKLVHNKPMEEVFVPGNRGELNILPGHSPLVTTLTEGVLRYRLKGDSKEHNVAISWGYCEITPKGVNIMAETAETPEEIDLSRAKEALEKSEKALQSADLTPADIEKQQRKGFRAQARIQVAESTKH